MCRKIWGTIGNHFHNRLSTNICIPGWPRLERTVGCLSGSVLQEFASIFLPYGTLNKFENMMNTCSWPCLLCSDLQFGVAFVDGKRIFHSSSNILKMRIPVAVDEGPILQRNIVQKFDKTGIFTTELNRQKRIETGIFTVGLRAMVYELAAGDMFLPGYLLSKPC